MLLVEGAGSGEEAFALLLVEKVLDLLLVVAGEMVLEFLVGEVRELGGDGEGVQGRGVEFGGVQVVH